MEHIIFKNLLTNKKFIKTFFRHIKPEYFKCQDKDFIKYLLDFFNKFKKVPSYEILEEFVKSQVNDEKKIVEFKKVISEIKSVVIKDDYSTIEGMTKCWLERMKIELGLVNTITLLDRSDVEKAQKELANIARPLNLEIGSEVTNLSLNQDEFFKDINKNTNNFKTGYKWFDHITTGGWEPGCVNIFAGPTNIGKTLILLSLAAQAYKKNQNTLFISYEIGKTKIQEKFLASLCGIEIPDVRNSKEQVSDTFKQYESSISIEYLPDGSSILDLETLIEEYMRNINPNLSILVVDYIGCIRSTLSNDKNGLYERFGDVIGELKRLAEKFGVCILTAQQLNRSGYNKGIDEMDISMMSDSMKLGHKADNVFLISIVEENLERIVEIKLDKTRSSPYNKSKQFFKMVKMKQQLIEMSEEEVQNYVTENIDEIIKTKRKKETL